MYLDQVLINLNIILIIIKKKLGPYVCAEHDYGGLPWWLLANGTDNIVPRSSESNYMNAVRRYYGVLLPKLVPYLYKNGGPIITVQVKYYFLGILNRLLIDGVNGCI